MKRKTHKFKVFLRWLFPIAFVLWTLPIVYTSWQNHKEQVFTGVVIDKFEYGSVGRHSVSTHHKIQFCQIKDKSKCAIVNIRSSTWNQTKIHDIQTYTLKKSAFIDNHVIHNIGLIIGMFYVLILGLVVLFVLWYLIYGDD